MAEHAATPGPGVSGSMWENWREGGPAPLMLNPDADLHTLLGWCWGEADRLCRTMGVALHIPASGGPHGGEVAEIAYQQLMPLVEMLGHLAALTQRDPPRMRTPKVND